MFHHKIDTDDAAPVETIEPDRHKPGVLGRFYAALIVVLLPFILFGLLVRIVWEDLKSAARGIAIFYRAAADELSRP